MQYLLLLVNRPCQKMKEAHICTHRLSLDVGWSAMYTAVDILPLLQKYRHFN